MLKKFSLSTRIMFLGGAVTLCFLLLMGWMHPTAALVGKSQADLKDVDGKYIFREFVEIVRKSGEGVVDYHWKKPNEESPSPKISYVKSIPEWGWVVGTGIYVDDVEREAHRFFGLLYGVASLILAGALTLSWWMARTISRPIDRVICTLNESAAQISSASEEVATSSQSLAEGASEQAASLEETAAAVEAGAGFAVVADEVRNLAQRAAGAAKNTSGLIEQTIRRIKDGTVLVEKTESDFTEVTNSVRKVTGLAGEVAAASAEQSRGISEVSNSVSRMDRTTQSNAACAEEIAASSEEMNSQAINLQEIVHSLELMMKGERNHPPVFVAAKRKPDDRSRTFPPSGLRIGDRHDTRSSLFPSGSLPLGNAAMSAS